MTTLLEAESPLVTNTSPDVSAKAQPSVAAKSDEHIESASELVSETGHESLETKTLIDDLSNFFERFVFIREECLYPFLAVWTIATYLHEQFEYVGYVFAYSAKPQSGKSRLLEVLDLLVFNSSGILVSPSEAVLFRTAFKSTQLLDELDSWNNRELLRSVLNAGFRRGNTVPRMAALSDGDYQVQKFPVYGPRVLAGIGEKTLSEPTRDRTFLLEMVPQKPEERREPFRMTQLKPVAEILRKKIGEWATTHKADVTSCYERGDFPYLDGFRDRTIDISQPLAAVIEVLFKGGTGIDAARHELIRAISQARKQEVDLNTDMRIFSKLYELTSLGEPAVGTASELFRMLGEPVRDEYELSAVLRRYGFSTKSIRRDDGPKYRYELEQTTIADIIDRFQPKRG